MEGAAEAKHRQREKAVSRAGTLDQPRGEESLVMAGEAEEEEDGGGKFGFAKHSQQNSSAKESAIKSKDVVVRKNTLVP